MSDSVHLGLAHACHRLLRPVVRILLRHGVTYNDFSEIARTVYAEVARESFTPEGKQPTDTRVATVTGLTRKDVKRLREHHDDGYAEREWGGANRATRVLSGWHRDPDFTDARGEPRALSLETGFADLVHRYSGDIPATAILDELERARVVTRDDDGRLRVVERAFVPAAGDPESIRMLGSAGHDLLATLEYNLARPPDTPSRFQRSVFDSRVDPRALALFHRLVSQHGQQLLETLDDWLEQHEITDESATATGVRTGVGIYYFQDDESEGSNTP